MRFFAEPVLNDSEVLRMTSGEEFGMTTLLLFAPKIAAIDARPPVLGWAQTARGRAFEQK